MIRVRLSPELKYPSKLWMYLNAASRSVPRCCDLQGLSNYRRSHEQVPRLAWGAGGGRVHSSLRLELDTTTVGVASGRVETLGNLSAVLSYLSVYRIFFVQLHILSSLVCKLVSLLQGRSYHRGRGGNCPPPTNRYCPPTKLLENQNFPWEMTIFYSASVETL